ncbi:methyltransferase type 11 [Bacillus sp. SA1-12]|uniref:class I SAM-dependent methyltransferase n=1 Tax=Bacillus sp. SA1-12 TaxID=1455638 RepID=UPI000626799B|nr:methyltransferase domain-containing protein [Bacillus sp. SA1-12]KKI91977.1 methyltransferase type 11 [Bacillus sp. SA1-12]
MEKTFNKKDLWNADLYDAKHSFVSKYGEGLLDLLAPKPGEKILDLGCGTGDLAKKIVGYGSEVVGVDKSQNMIAQAKGKYPEIRFEIKDATNLDFNQQFDAVFSNAALHWIKPPKAAVISIYNSLKQNGRFVAEFGGKGNVKMITDEISNQLKKAGIDYYQDKFPWYFPSISEYTRLMEEAGFTVVYAQLYHRPTPLMGEDGLKNWINMFCANFFEGMEQVQRDKMMKRIEEQLKDRMFFEDHWLADFRRIRVVGMKE